MGSVLFLIVFVVFFGLFILLNHGSSLQITSLYISSVALILAIPLIFLYSFDKEETKERLYEYKNHLTLKLSEKEDDKSSNLKNSIQPIALEASLNGRLFWLLKEYNIINCKANIEYAKFSSEIFLKESMGKYTSEYINNHITKSKNSRKRCHSFQNYFDNTLYNKSKERVEISIDTSERASSIYQHLMNSPFSFKIKEEQLKVLLQLYTHNVIEGNDRFLELPQTEKDSLEKLKEDRFRKW